MRSETAGADVGRLGETTGLICRYMAERMSTYTKHDETDLTVKNLPPQNTFLVYDDTIEQNELFGVYYYARVDDTDRSKTTYIATVSLRTINTC